jgi:hypothetical protein
MKTKRDGERLGREAENETKRDVSPYCGAEHDGYRCTMFRGHATNYHTATVDGKAILRWYDDDREFKM